MTSPMNSSGMVTSTRIIGSRMTGSALWTASLTAIEAAILNAISERVDLVVRAVDGRSP